MDTVEWAGVVRRNLFDCRLTAADGVLRVILPFTVSGPGVRITFTHPHGLGPDSRPVAVTQTTSYRLGLPRVPGWSTPVDWPSMN